MAGFHDAGNGFRKEPRLNSATLQSITVDEKSVDIRPIDAFGILLPQHPFAADVSGRSDTDWFFDLQIAQCRPPWLAASTILGI
jgi:hypothetical protein